MLKRVAVAMVVALAVGAAASAQTNGSGAAGAVGSGVCSNAGSGGPAAGQNQSRLRRCTARNDDPDGDTGLWFVPTAEILPAKRWSGSAYRVNFDYQQGFTDVSNWPVTFGYRPG